MKHSMFNTLAGAAMAMAAQGATAAPVLQYGSNGRLTGATGVQVDGSLFDVQFVSGTCADAFGAQCTNGPNASSTFLFSQAMAIDASQALIDQLDIGNQTLGANCNVACTTVLTPFNTFGATVQTEAVGRAHSNAAPTFSNSAPSYSNSAPTFSNSAPTVSTTTISEIDIGLYSNTFYLNDTFAVFTASADVASDVPEPVSAVLLAGGVVAAGVARRKLRKA